MSSGQIQDPLAQSVPRKCQWIASGKNISKMQSLRKISYQVQQKSYEIAHKFWSRLRRTSSQTKTRSISCEKQQENNIVELFFFSLNEYLHIFLIITLTLVTVQNFNKIPTIKVAAVDSKKKVDSIFRLLSCASICFCKQLLVLLFIWCRIQVMCKRFPNNSTQRFNTYQIQHHHQL